jgi:hypothetical protein
MTPGLMEILASPRQERLPMEVPRSPGWCPAVNCGRPCGPGDCHCPPCRCAGCRARSGKARRCRLSRSEVPNAVTFQPRLFAHPSRERSLIQ